jgi:hypothetical protein
VARPGGARPADTSRCPLHDHGTVVSRRSGADAALVPDGAVALLLCRYSGLTQPPPSPNAGPAHRLTAVARLGNRSEVRRFAHKLNAIAPQSGAVSCPADFGDRLVAYFLYAFGRPSPVAVGLSGCELLSNGTVNRVALDAPVVAEMTRLAQPSTLQGRLQLCGGPAPGGCRTEQFTSCDPSGCITADRVGVFTADGRHLATVRLRRARFSLLVPAGRYIGAGGQRA